MKIKQRGNTLIELLLATVIVGVMLTGVAISLTYSIQREALSRYREGATDLAAEISEYFLLRRAQQNWRGFYDNLSNSSYCYNPVNPPSITAGASCAGISRLGMDFDSEITITKTGGPEKISALITITWNVDGEDRTYELVQEYYEREF